MSYKLDKNGITDIQKADFIVEYNHKKGLKIEETANAIYALEQNEIMKNGIPIINPNYEQEIAEERKKQFEKDFFETSLGWIRRTVTMKNGSQKDFLSDLLLQIKAGIEMGNNVEIITYSLPDFTKDFDNEYIVSLQEKKSADINFVAECLQKTVQDFSG